MSNNRKREGSGKGRGKGRGKELGNGRGIIKSKKERPDKSPPLEGGDFY